MNGQPPRGPLSGIRVLDLSRVLAGPYCTTQLYELGAEVLKVEQPGHGDDTRAFPPFLNGESVYFASINRGKRSIALDLRVENDRKVFDALLAKADVLVENFRPGVMEALGYGWETVHAKHPALIYAAISGFGQTGPYRDLPAYDLVVQALGGMISINGPEGGTPVRLGISLADLGAGLFAALGVTAALFDRKTSGVGRLVDIAMLDCQTLLLESALVRQFASGETQKPTGSRHPVITPFDVFQTLDGPIAIACANDHLFATLAAAIDRPGLATDERFASLFARYANHVALKGELESALSQKSATAWIESLQAAGVPCAPVQDMAAVIKDPQLLARNMFVEVDDPEMGKLKMSGNAVKISGFPDSATRPPAPNLDEARADVLAELGEAPEGPRDRTREGPKQPVW
ncbi:MAG: CoA transferase [Hyphomonadaceae bacterium]|nr:MAG: CoA-transferase [Caulobacteraceae bacterium]MBT9445937.1 CoA transferase [Hyphomonadaceae bacterium]TPW04769.1 MAG: CoA-transferase [Alphaproteobacteria bacterium]